MSPVSGMALYFLLPIVLRRSVVGFSLGDRHLEHRADSIRVASFDTSRCRSDTTGASIGTRLGASSFETGADEESEQLLAAEPLNTSSKQSGRFADVLESVGIDQTMLKQVPHLPEKRTLSPNDVFCNRELKMSTLQAVGFDMDYTLAQYKQPAFDQLAFDGAKEKLVAALGYPEGVIDFQYDHTVS